MWQKYMTVKVQAQIITGIILLIVRILLRRYIVRDVVMDLKVWEQGFKGDEKVGEIFENDWKVGQVSEENQKV